MKIIEADNVNDAWSQAITIMNRAIENKEVIIREARKDVTKTYELRTPVMTVYKNPRQRVLFDPVRDCNPYFHFFEALWMLAGRNDVKWLAHFLPRIADFSNGGVILDGAYGYRLRVAQETDQLHIVVKMLKNNPETRRAVLQIWDTGIDLGSDSKDIPCNDLIFLSVVDGKLDMTVCCRSNDIIYGCYGANAVHFSMIMEYLADCIGIEMGYYRHLSNNWHIYEDNPKYKSLIQEAKKDNPRCYDLYRTGKAEPYKGMMVEEPALFDLDLEKFMELTEDHSWTVRMSECSFENRFFYNVVIPMYNSFKVYKKGDVDGAMKKADKILADDWRVACFGWLNRRMK